MTEKILLVSTNHDFLISANSDFQELHGIEFEILENYQELLITPGLYDLYYSVIFFIDDINSIESKKLLSVISSFPKKIFVFDKKINSKTAEELLSQFTKEKKTILFYDSITNDYSEISAYFINLLKESNEKKQTFFKDIITNYKEALLKYEDKSISCKFKRTFDEVKTFASSPRFISHSELLKPLFENPEEYQLYCLYAEMLKYRIRLENFIKSNSLEDIIQEVR